MLAAREDENKDKFCFGKKKRTTRFIYFLVETTWITRFQGEKFFFWSKGREVFFFRWAINSWARSERRVSFKLHWACSVS